MNIQTYNLWSFLKEYRWLLFLGTLIGLTVTIDPYFYYEYVPDDAELGLLGKLWWFPFLLPLLLATLPFLIRFLYHKAKALTRLQRDSILFFLFVSTMFINYWAWLHIHLTMMLVITGIFLLFIRSALAGRFDLVILPIDSYYLLLILFMMVSLYGPAGGAGSTMGNVGQFVMSMFIPVLFIHNVIRTRKQFMKTIKYMIYVSIFSCSLAIIQYIAFRFFSYNMTYNWNLTLGNMITLPIFGTWSRCAGLSANSNYLGFSTGTITVFMTYLLVKPHSFLSRSTKRFLLVAVILCLFGSLFSASRGSWLAMFVCYFFIPFIAYPKYWKKFLLILFIICVVGFGTGLFQYGYDVMHSMRSEAVNIRERLMRLGIDCIINHPWTGAGFGGFVDYWNFDDDEVHNMWFNVCSQIGIPGTLVLVAYFLSVIYRLSRAIVRTSGFDRLILESLLVSLMFFVVNSTVRPMIWGKFFWLYFGFVETAIHLFYRVRGKVKVYYPIFGYSWKEEPSVQIERKYNRNGEE